MSLAARAEHGPLPLELLREAKVRDLLGAAADGHRRLEASGVLARPGGFMVIFDNVPHVARIGWTLTPGSPDNRLVRRSPGGVGYEDIARDPATGRLFLLVEAEAYAPGVFMAKVQELDEDLRGRHSRWLDLPLDRPNKGLEGLTCVRRAGRTHLLGLCEGNRCRAGTAGRRPGGGRIHVFVEGDDRWHRVHTIRLPGSVMFEDYSSLSVVDDRIAVVSQQSSALWTGRLAASSWELVDDGTTYAFPTDSRGRIEYGNVEGVSWLAPDEVVVVSDRAKAGQRPRSRDKDESIHVFALPGVAAG
ncbi:MAG TPA: hypothetical protein VEL73_08430 [Mycobacteriales bacterium]|nr:hypothetical protein [Mycobacteriales bacterium]